MGSGAVRQVLVSAVLQEQQRQQQRQQEQQHMTGRVRTQTLAAASEHILSPENPPLSASDRRLNPSLTLPGPGQVQAQVYSHAPGQTEDATEALILSSIALAGIAQQWMLPGLLHECASIVFETVSMETALGAVQAAWDESVGIIVEGLAALLAPHYSKLQYSGRLASVSDQLADLLRSTFVESKVL